MFTTAHVDYQTYKSEEGRLAEKAFFQHHGAVSENFTGNIVQARTRPGELAPDLRWLFGSIDGYSMCRVKGPADGTVSSEHVAVRMFATRRWLLKIHYKQALLLPMDNM